jgi:signal peptidase I
MLYPFIIYLVLENTYAKASFATAYKDRKQNIFWTSGLLVMVTLLIMLISCQFKYGIIVIGSNSMTGTINKGDGIIFKKYDGERLEKGQVILFNYNDIKTVHRIVEIRVVNGEARYVTQGDANQNVDTGYRLTKDIQGTVDIRIKYIGLPTLWLRSLFKR